MCKSNFQGKTKLLYIATADAVNGEMAKIGITANSFKERWRRHNAANPAVLHRKECFSIRLPEAEAKRAEDHIKANYSMEDAGEWVKLSPDTLKEIVVGFVFIHCKEARKDLGRRIDGRKQLDYILDDSQPKPTASPVGETVVVAPIPSEG